MLRTDEDILSADEREEKEVEVLLSWSLLFSWEPLSNWTIVIDRCQSNKRLYKTNLAKKFELNCYVEIVHGKKWKLRAISREKNQFLINKMLGMCLVH